MSNSPLTYHVRIADLADDDKPREKALKHGIRSLSDTELIAILLGSGLSGKSVLELSNEIYSTCGQSLSNMAQMSIRDMCKRFHGIGLAKAITIAAALEIGGRRKDIKGNQKPQIKCASDAYDVIRQQVENLTTEEFWLILLSRSNRVISCECISRGGTSATIVEPKIVMKRAVEHLATSVILVHNHPSDNLHPSIQDDAITQKLQQAGTLLEIPIIDHLIIGPSGFYSYAESGKL